MNGSTRLSWVLALTLAAGGAAPAVELLDHLDPRPRSVTWVEPRALALPSSETLETVVITNRDYHVVRVSKGADQHGINRGLATQGKAPAGFDPTKAAGFYEKADEALTFVGSGGAGKRSHERLIVENCTFLIDFQEGEFEKWNPHRSAIYVEGYKEVVIRDCVFVSKTLPTDPLRKVIASICAYDCGNVQIENCYFEGRTVGFRGHVLVFCCGPTSIRNCEVNGKNRVTGGLWVASGFGEGKIGYMHGDQPDLMIYPPGPLLIENCWIHDQLGKENADGIYVQSVRPYLIRNCKVEKWQEDSLIDVGFRDTSKKWGDGFLPNHGGLGVVENCEFADGYVKDSVGLGGGLVFRGNRLRNAWFFPYAFDGGSWYVVGNVFDPMARVVLSGRNSQTDGWTPGEGMFAKGGKLFFFNNTVRQGAKPAALFVAGAKAGPVKETVVSDYNVYDVDPSATWAIEHDQTALPFDAWRSATSNDGHSTVGPGTLEAFAGVDPKTVVLPGGIPMKWGPGMAGLTGPVGVTNPAVLKRAKDLSAAIALDLARANLTLQVESLPRQEASLTVKKETRTWSGGVAWLVLDGQPGQSVSFDLEVSQGARYYLASLPQNRIPIKAGRYQLSVDGQKVGEPLPIAGGESVRHGAVSLTAGIHRLTYTLAEAGAEGGTAAVLDALNLRDADMVDRDQARLKAIAARTAAARAAAEALEATKIKFAVVDLPVAGKIKGHLSEAEVKGQKYRLWQAQGKGDSVSFGVEAPKAGGYEVSVVTYQQSDAGSLQLLVDGKEVGAPQKISGSLTFGQAELAEGGHTVQLRLAAPENAGALKVRLLRIDLLPEAPGSDKPTGAQAGETP